MLAWAVKGGQLWLPAFLLADGLGAKLRYNLSLLP
jgi:hypothetical protein